MEKQQLAQLQEQLAGQLRDVHLPESVSWWPLAFGWWLLIGLALCSLTLLCLWLVHRWRSERYRKTACAELAGIFTVWQNDANVQAYLNASNGVLKRVVLQLRPTEQVASLSGAAWVRQLDQLGKKPLTPKTADALANQCYQPTPSADVDALHKELLLWLSSHRSDTAQSQTTAQSQRAETEQHA